MKRISSFALLFVAGNALFATCPAQSQEKLEYKLKINSLRFSPTSDGFYDATVDVVLQNHEGIGVLGIPVGIKHVSTIKETLEQVKPKIDDLSDEIKKASDDFEKHH